METLTEELSELLDEKLSPLIKDLNDIKKSLRHIKSDLNLSDEILVRIENITKNVEAKVITIHSKLRQE